jgi:hypothetical protein
MEPATNDAYALAFHDLVREMRESRHAATLRKMGFLLIKAAAPNEESTDECIFFASERETIAVDEFGCMWRAGGTIDLTRLQFIDVTEKLRSILDRLPHAASDN